MWMLKTQSSFHIVVLKTCDHPWNQLDFRMYVLEYEMTSLKSLCTYYTCSYGEWIQNISFFLLYVRFKNPKFNPFFLVVLLCLLNKKNLYGEVFHLAWFILGLLHLSMCSFPCNFTKVEFTKFKREGMFISLCETIHEGPFYKQLYKKNVHNLTNSKRKGMLISSYEAIDYKKFELV